MRWFNFLFEAGFKKRDSANAAQIAIFPTIL